MRAIKFLIAIILCLTINSCAHKSGHNKDNRPNRSAVKNGSNSKSEQTATLGERRDLNVAVTNNRGNNNKFDGAEIFAKYNTAVFMVFTSDGYDGHQGSGFFINSNGLAVSNYHVFRGTSAGAEQIKLAGSDNVYKVSEVIHSSKDEDFILFRVNVSNTNYIPLAKNKPQIGEKVYAIGSPHGLENTFSSGEVSQWRDENLMQISALIDQGSSGGALINEYGEVVGITSGTFAYGSQANLNYAWSIDVVKPFVNYK